ncbi:superoxide dismutase family protein [Sphingomonas sp. BIUV-7]|uniref:Superoxide dismutase family protein n=1 Tax=Sphingomonas natans TaxID=3063330 RepID=A0ABT8Y9Q9_9SPHN|nr:superoxide dismutase family protein [Sphingomonas sp. BIUV-7]MDO6415059.1 superoxide dismutase family protein [Sphingomonas sp. BIUV-7]
MRFSHMLALIAAAALPAAAVAHVVPLKNNAGASAGSVDLIAAPKGLLIKVDATGLTPGWHAIHIHEKADCSDAAFKMAGAHTHSATPAAHGLLNPAANDTGDLPNIYAGADGTAKAELFTTLTMMAPLHDADGSAIVIHAKADDYTTQPIGGAGDRVACGAFK